MKKFRALLTSLLIILTISLLPIPSNAVNQNVEKVISGETVYGAAGWKTPSYYTITMPTSGEMVMDLKTDGSLVITVQDKNRKVFAPSKYEEQTRYGSHAGHNISGYYLSYANNNETKVAHAIFYYQLTPGEYSITISANVLSSIEMIISTPIGFSDVPDNAWYAEPVKWAIEGNITAGTSSTTFSPGATCTTAQILTFLWRANGSPEPYASNPFSNVSDQFYAKPAIWAYENGLINGNTFDANSPCTRSATVMYLWKLSSQPISSTSVFSDVPAESDYAQAVAWAVDEGITSGTGKNTFSPDDICTRAHIVSFLYRYFN